MKRMVRQLPLVWMTTYSNLNHLASFLSRLFDSLLAARRRLRVFACRFYPCHFIHQNHGQRIPYTIWGITSAASGRSPESLRGMLRTFFFPARSILSGFPYRPFQESRCHFHTDFRDIAPKKKTHTQKNPFF